MLYPCSTGEVGSEATSALVRSHLLLGLGSEALWARPLVVSLELNLPLELGKRFALDFTLGVACNQSGVGPAPDPMVHLGLHQSSVA
jgi:hypothetical protein